MTAEAEKLGESRRVGKLSEMKHLVLFTALMSAFAMAFGQNIVGKSYVSDVPDTKAYKIDKANVKLVADDNFVYMKTKTKFTVIDLTDGKAIIKFWNFSGGTPIATVDERYDYANATAYADGNCNGRHFLIELDDLDTRCTEYNGSAHSFTWGAVTVPIKIRFGDGDSTYFGFEPTANLGLTAGYRYQIKGRANHALNVLGGTSIGSTSFRKVDFETAYVNTDTVTDFSGTGLVLSTILGLVYQYDSFQIGLFTGLDFLPNELGRQWKHQGIPWLGVGIGIGLFSKEKEEKAQGNN